MPVETINGLPAHALLVHAVVVLAPLTAVLAILCAIWPAARRRLVWLVLVLAAVLLVLTPVTIKAGERLEERVGASPAIEAHEELGKLMLYFAIALFVAALCVVLMHLRTLGAVACAVAAAFVVAVSGATIMQVIRTGDSGAEATWGQLMENLPPAN
jgi:ABC-type branched-subunit amino acid transport system permease subunit